MLLHFHFFHWVHRFTVSEKIVTFSWSCQNYIIGCWAMHCRRPDLAEKQESASYRGVCSASKEQRSQSAWISAASENDTLPMTGFYLQLYLCVCVCMMYKSIQFSITQKIKLIYSCNENHLIKAFSNIVSHLYIIKIRTFLFVFLFLFSK